MRLRRKTLSETSLEEQTEPDEETGGPRRDFGSPDVRLSGSVDRVHLERAVQQLPPVTSPSSFCTTSRVTSTTRLPTIMNCSIGNSKSQLHKARMRLRELLQEQARSEAREQRQADKAKTGISGNETERPE